MLSLTADSIKDFQTCARLYDFRYNDKLYESILKRDMIANRFEEVLKKIVTFFFYKKQSGTVPSYAALLNRWERLWFPKDTTAYDLLTERHETVNGNLVSYSNMAAAALLSFYEKFVNDEGEPFLVNEEFLVPYSKTIKLAGVFDCVLRYRKNDLYVVFKWHTKVKKPPISSFDTFFTMQHYALDYKMSSSSSYNPNYKIVSGLYDLVSIKPKFIHADVNREDFASLDYWIKEIEKEKIFPNRRDLTLYCKSCPFYDDECASWSLETAQAQ